MKKKFLGRLLTMLLVAAMVFTLLPASAIAADWWGSADEYADDVSTQATTDETTDEFIRVFHLDCGRQYFSVEQIKEIIKTLAENHYTHLELAIGNDALRFLLDDMSISFEANGKVKSFNSDDIKTGIKNGNKAYRNCGTYNELSQTDMNDIIQYAKTNNIEIIPLLNSPGHMDAVIDCMEEVGISNPAFSYSESSRWGTTTYTSTRTVDVTNAEAVAFTKSLVKKYADYFKGMGCNYFNIGADEYANDLFIDSSNSYYNKGLGFGYICDNNLYSGFVTYVNEIAQVVIDAQLRPMAFNDGIYYNNKTDDTFNQQILICYWSAGGYNGLKHATASFLHDQGHEIINTNDSWYYVLGRTSGTYGLNSNKAGSVSCTTTNSDYTGDLAGCMQCVWADEAVNVGATEMSNIKTLIHTLSNANPAYFVAPAEPEITIKPSTENPKLDSASETASVTLDAGEVVTWTWDPALVSLVSADSDISTYAATDASLEAQRVTVTPVEGATGTATITASRDGKTAAFDIEVYDSSAPTEIFLSVGGTKEIILPGDVTGKIDRTQLVESIATVTAEYNPDTGKTEYSKQSMPTSQYGTTSGVISDGNGNYLCISSTGDITNTTDISKATEFTVTKTNRSSAIDNYSIKANNSNYYLIHNSNQLSASTSSSTWRYSDEDGFYFTNRGTYYVTFTSGNWKTSSSSTSTKGFLYARTEEKTDPVDKTVITITGKSVGTTYVTIDGTTYKINVSDKAPNDAMNSVAITLEHWITNVHATSTESGSKFTVSISQSEAQSEAGIEITSKKFANAYWGTEEVYYWKAVRLASSAKQTTAAGADQTAAGTTLTHIRYYNNAWQYKTTDGTWHYFLTGDQLVAYYLKKVVVTPQIDTYYKDWGYNTDGIGGSDYGQVALSVAVVYPNGTISPAEDNIFGKSTTIFNYWNNGSGTHKERRDMGIVLAENNSNYDISKITVTNGLRTGYTADLDGSSNSQWSSSNTITWDKIEDDAGNKWYDETVVWDENSGTEPVVNAANKTGDDDAVYVFQGANTAKLVLIYLKPVQKSTNLNVVYYNDNDKEEIFSMQVAMTYNQGDTEPTYANSLYLYGTVNTDGTVKGGTLIAEDKSSWSSNVVGDDEYLPDAAYVVNAGKEAQTFSKTLSTIPGVAAKYKSGVYQYISADISSDGKTLTLHYAIDASKLDQKYIFDFGLPIEIPLSKLVQNPEDVEYLSVNGTNLFENSVKTAYGTLSYDSSTASVVFTLDKAVDTQTPLTSSFRVKYKTATTLSKAITIALLPASNVLYEENFLNSADGWTNGDSAAPTTAQETQRAGETKNVFGYDAAYKTKTGASGVLATTGKLSYGGGLVGPLTTSFYGNAFDLIGNCATDSGRVFLVIKGANKTTIADIDTRYAKGPINQVPLAHIELGTDDSYEVKVYAAGLAEVKPASASSVQMMSARAYSSRVDADLQAVLSANGLTMSDVQYINMAAEPVTAVSSIATYADTASTIERPAGTHVEIDGFRVYRSSNNSSYPTNEQKVTYQNILDVVKDEITAYTEADGSKTVKVEDYEANGGPQNEIYLGANQSVTFNVNSATPIQVSLRAVNGDVQWATSTTGGSVAVIESNTEMYYTVTPAANGDITIANRGDTLLAIGNVKLPAGTVTTSASEMDETAVYESVCAAFAASLPVDPEPEQPTVFVPEHFSIRDYATRFFRSKLVTLRIDFSKDVSYVEIDGRKYTPNKLASWFGYYTVTFTDTIGRNDNYFYKVVFFDANGNPSETQSVYGK